MSSRVRPTELSGGTADTVKEIRDTLSTNVMRALRVRGYVDDGNGLFGTLKLKVVPRSKSSPVSSMGTSESTGTSAASLASSTRRRSNGRKRARKKGIRHRSKEEEEEVEEEEDDEDEEDDGDDDTENEDDPRAGAVGRDSGRPMQRTPVVMPALSRTGELFGAASSASSPSIARNTSFEMSGVVLATPAESDDPKFVLSTKPAKLLRSLGTSRDPAVEATMTLNEHEGPLSRVVSFKKHIWCIIGGVQYHVRGTVNVRFEVYLGDITRSNRQVITNAANAECKFGTSYGGVTNAISNFYMDGATGTDDLRQLNERVADAFHNQYPNGTFSQKKTLTPGEVLFVRQPKTIRRNRKSSRGQNTYTIEYIANTIAPKLKMGSYRPTKDQVVGLVAAYSNVIIGCATRGMKTVCIPLLGAFNYHWDATDSYMAFVMGLCLAPQFLEEQWYQDNLRQLRVLLVFYHKTKPAIPSFARLTPKEGGLFAMQ
jgi:O-acetyl-ADP-ribose deacetylase (regulator of RNase III)